MKRLVWTLASVGLVMVLCAAAQAAYMDKDLSTGDVRVHYPSAISGDCEAIVLGVGTAMTRGGYDNLSEALTDYGYVVVIMDHSPGNMIKTDAAEYRACALDVQANLVSWLSGTGCTGIAHWILGGHSAGGQAAQEAIAADPTLADAVFSIDPYDCSDTDMVSLPALYWGFNVTTCFVTKADAAEAAYYGSASQRVFQRVATVYTWTWCGYSPKYFHCSFCDNHCPACTNCSYTPDSFFDDVAASVHKFVNAAFYGTWSKANLTLSNPTTPVTLFVDSDQP